MAVRNKDRELAEKGFDADATELQVYPLLHRGPWLAKAVPDVAVGQDVRWIGWIIIKFLAELTNENAQIRAVADKVRATQGAKQTRVGERTARLGHEKLKCIELARR